MVEEEQVELIDRDQDATNVGSSVEVIRAPLDRFKTHVLDTMRRPPPATTDTAAESRARGPSSTTRPTARRPMRCRARSRVGGTTWCLR